MSVECVKLVDSNAGTSARIAVGFGFNCFEFKVGSGDSAIDVFWSHPEFASGTQRASHSGNPILFPFAGRIPGTKFSWMGKTYDLVEGDGIGNAIHGYVLDRPWQTQNLSIKSVTADFQASRDDTSLLSKWPSDFRITSTYTLDGTKLTQEISVTNTGHYPMPYGLGLHPYFRLPIGGSSADQCLLTLPADKRWELTDMLPTGNSMDFSDKEQFQAGIPIEHVTLDDVFGDLQASSGTVKPRLTDNESRRFVQLAFDENYFREIVVYTPPHREAICIEPYTMVPASFHLHEKGQDTGVKTLQPGETHNSTIEISVGEIEDE